VNNVAGFLPFVLIALVFWFLIVRPQRRRSHDLATTQAALDLGTEVMLGSGIFGTVASLEDETLHLELAPGVVVKVARQAVVKVLDGPDEDGFGEHDPDRAETQHSDEHDPHETDGPSDERHQ
jgi:preprotein translocase subunit YajC